MNKGIQATLAAAVMVALAFTPGAGAAGDPAQCSDNANGNNDMSCSFTCLVGDTVSVTVRGDGHGWGSAECNGASAGCEGWEGYCSDRSEDSSTVAGEGQCSANMEDGGLLCTSQPGPSSLAVVQDLLRLLQSGAGCDELLQVAVPGGHNSFVYMLFENGQVKSMVSWGGDHGLARPPEIVGGIGRILAPEPCEIVSA